MVEPDGILFCPQLIAGLFEVVLETISLKVLGLERRKCPSHGGQSYCLGVYSNVCKGSFLFCQKLNFRVAAYPVLTLHIWNSVLLSLNSV